MSEHPQPRLRDALSRSWPIVKVIAKKELVDTLRDRRTLATMLLVPCVMYPLMILTTSELIAVERSAAEERRVQVAAYRALPEAVSRSLRSAEGITLLEAPLTTSTAAASVPLMRGAMARDDVDVIVVSSATASAALEALETARVAVYYDETGPFSRTDAMRLRDALVDAAIALRDTRMAGLGLDPSTARPLDIDVLSVSTDSERGGHLASMYVPVLILFFIALSTFYPAVDLTAGEKERGTLATLLCAPISALEIVGGKYLAVVTVGTFAGLLNILVMSLTVLRAVASAPGTVSTAFPVLSAPVFVGLLFAVLLMALLVGSVMLTAATLARSFRDASNLLTPVLFITLAPAILATLPTSSLTAGWAAVPIANGMLMMKALLTTGFLPGPFSITTVTTLIYTAGLLTLAARLYSDERALFSTEGRRARFSDIFVAPGDPGVGVALGFTSLLFIGNYYGGLFVDSTSPTVGIAAVQITVNFIPAVIAARWLRARIDPRRTLRLTRPTPGALLSGGLVGAGAWLGLSLPILWMQAELHGGQSAASEALASALGLEQTPLPVLLVCLAVVPAIAEELAFRGVVLSVLSRALRPWTAILAQAALFGILHGSAFRFFPTAALGAALGLLAMRTGSIWPGVIAHMLTNGVALTLQSKGLAHHFESPTPWALLGLVALAVGLLRAPRRERDAQ